MPYLSCRVLYSTRVRRERGRLAETGISTPCALSIGTFLKALAQFLSTSPSTCDKSVSCISKVYIVLNDTMMSRQPPRLSRFAKCPSRCLHSLRHSQIRPVLQTRNPPLSHRRTLIAAPSANSGPLMERRPDRELPEVPQPWKMWARTMPIFLAIVTLSSLGIFNYQKQSSSVVASTLYALRTSDLGRQELGDEIYFRDRFPWIWGQMDQLHGKIDIQFGVKGTKGSGMMRFRSERPRRMGFVSKTLSPCQFQQPISNIEGTASTDTRLLADSAIRIVRDERVELGNS